MINIDKEGMEELQFGSIGGHDIAIISSRMETDGSTSLDIVFLGGKNKGKRTRIDHAESCDDLTLDAELDDSGFNEKLISLIQKGIFSLLEEG